jgi:pyroglutamyl-peptidase
MRLRLVSLTLAAAAACGESPPAGRDPNAGLLRDFVADDGKFDSGGTPLNARVTEAERRCFRRGREIDGVFTVRATDGAGEVCRGLLEGGVQRGRMIVDVRLRATPDDEDRPIAVFRVWSPKGVVATATLTPRSLRGDGWMSFPIAYQNDGVARNDIAVEYLGNGTLELDAFEVFPRDLDLAIAPGSGEFLDDDWITFEAGLDETAIAVTANGVDVTARLTALLEAGDAFVETTEYRRLTSVTAGDLLAGIPGTVELAARTRTGAARIQVRRAPPACDFVGSAGKKILVTGFQAFPADAWHENVSQVALAAMPPVVGARVMRLVLPVEFDHAAEEVVEVIERCAPDVVLGLGQGGDGLALEEVAYNRKDTSEVPGGVPDNRGVVAIAEEIRPGGPAERDTRLPLADLEDALDALGQPHERSRDPGRYVCNDVFYAAAGTGVEAGFVHLPYRTTFSDADRTHWGNVVAAMVGAL